MRTILLTFFSLSFYYCVNGQVAFSNIDISLKKVSSQKGVEIVCTDSLLPIKFLLTHKSVQLQNNFVIVDSQPIQIVQLQVSGFNKKLNTLNVSEQKQFLSDYSQYELDYFTKELNIEIINPRNQWVFINSRNWFIWYFRVGNIPAQVDKKTEIQLFASTILENKVLTINAPVQENGDFNKAALMVNQMMESLTTKVKK